MIRRSSSPAKSTWRPLLPLALVIAFTTLAPNGYAQLPVPAPSAPTLDAPDLPPAPSLPEAPSLPSSPPVPAPALPAPSIPAPSLPAPELPAPTLPTAPAPSPPQLPSGSLPSAPSLGDGRDGDSGSLITFLSSPGGFGTAAGTGDAGVPGGLPPGDLAQLFANSSPQERRRLARRLWDRPLRGAELKRLRRFVEQRAGCLDVIADPARRVLLLRAGLAGRAPATRRFIARRLGVSLRGVLRLETVALVRLTRVCESPADAGALVLGRSIQSVVDEGSRVPPPVVATATERATGKGGVLGVTQSSPPPQSARLSLLEEDRGSVVPGTLLAFLAAALALILAGVLATGDRLAPSALPAALPRRRSGRPLLFVDVDGVIAVNPLTAVLPPGKWHSMGFSDIYVTDRAGEFLKRLASRFELVWATGWEHRANTHLPRLLGLEGDLAVLRFRGSMTFGRSDWKIDAIDRYARRRAAAWIDDNIAEPHLTWAAFRKAPTKLVQTDPHAGVSEGDVEALIAWADALEHVEAERPVRGAARRQHLRGSAW